MEKLMLWIVWDLPVMPVGDQIASSAFQALHNEMVENAFKTYLVTGEKGIK